MKLALLAILMFFSGNLAFTQKLSGIVRSESQSPIPGANILNLSNNEHAHSDDDGKFVFDKVVVGDSLYFAHLGFLPHTVVVKSIDKIMRVILEDNSISLEEIVITPGIDALKLINEIDIQTNPVNSSQDILRQVPGLFIGQHAGGGKAEQIFLRGFDIDHGTDIQLTVDGLPVNMVSHAHGQGYSDLHFVIPETVEAIDFGKGPYYASKGNFNTAGYVGFKTRDRLANSSVKIEGGQFDSKRMLGMFKLIDSGNHNAYIAAEYQSTDGFFESSQNFRRVNLFGKYSGYVSENDRIGFTASHFSSRWDASGQIPQRAVDRGLISRFGAIDDTEGGETSRTNILVDYDKYIDANSYIRNSVYYSQYDFELYSNFTFFLIDSVNSDQIRQKENRSLFGFSSDYNYSFDAGKWEGTFQAGISLRNDQSRNNELSRTKNRSELLSPIQLGDVNESNFGGYSSVSLTKGKWTLNPGIRVDLFDYQYTDELAPSYQVLNESKGILSPKLNILYDSSRDLQLYVKAGKGFHSNDTRVVVQQSEKEILPAAYGADAGFIWKPDRNTMINAAVWQLYLEQEFVYVGDEGIVEPSGETRREGIDLSIRHQFYKWLFLNLDANYTHARSVSSPDGEDYIPLAPDMTLQGGLNVVHPSGFFGGINVRHLNDRPANEDNSLVAKGYTVMDLNAGFEARSFEIAVNIQNLLDTQWNETQFATESRLRDESEGVEDIHFTPGTPFFLKGSVAYKF